MKLFEVVPDDEYGSDYLINAAHKWSVPGVACSVCGFKGSVIGIAYPNFSLPSQVDVKPYENAWPVTPERIRQLVIPFESLKAQGLPVHAGTEFGPLIGKASGRLGDFTWLNDWTPLVSKEALVGLSRHGISGLDLAVPEIQVRSKKTRFEHLELSIAPLVHAYEPDPGRRCDECGIPLDSEPETIEPYRPVILEDTFPKGLHLARVTEVPAFIVASEEFVRATRELGLTDIKFEKLEVR